MQSKRKSSPREDPIFQAASVGMSISQDASKEVGKFLVAAIVALEQNMQTILPRNDGDNPLGRFMQAFTQQMITRLKDRVNSATAIDPALTNETNDRVGGPPATGKAARARKTPGGTARSKTRRRRRAKRERSS